MPRWAALGLCLLVVGAVPSDVAAQGAEGYVWAGGGGWNTSGRFGSSGRLLGGGGGVEVLARPQFGIGGDVGAYTTPFGGFLLSLSVDGRVHVTRDSPTQRVVPSAGLGYSRLLFFEGADDAVSVFGGVDVRLGSSRALRFELRDMVRLERSTTHYWAIRVGMTFR